MVIHSANKMNSFAALKTKLKYFFSRLVVLLVAVQTLNVSIDIDHLSSQVSWYNHEQFDDVDSFAELIAENITGNDNLFCETGTDDTHSSEKQAAKFPVVVLYADFRRVIEITPSTSLAVAYRPLLRNTKLLAEDYSHADYNPPDKAIS